LPARQQTYVGRLFCADTVYSTDLRINYDSSDTAIHANKNILARSAEAKNSSATKSFSIQIFKWYRRIAGNLNRLGNRIGVQAFLITQQFLLEICVQKRQLFACRAQQFKTAQAEAQHFSVMTFAAPKV